MSSAGTILDMIIRVRNNAALVKGRRNKYKDLKDAYLKNVYKLYNLVDKSLLSSAELSELRNKIRTKIIRENRISVIKSVVTTIVIVIILSVLIYHYWNF